MRVPMSAEVNHDGITNEFANDTPKHGRPLKDVPVKQLKAILERSLHG